MGNAARAYQYPQRIPERSPRIEVVPGRRSFVQEETVSSSTVMVARIVAVFFVVFALLGFVRIGLASATVSTAVSTENTLEQIATARSAGNKLEKNYKKTTYKIHLYLVQM